MLLRTVIATCWLAVAAGIGLAGDYPWCSRMDEIRAEVVGGDLVLHHDRATYNCCPDTFSFTVTVSNDSLYVTEREVLTMPCDCLCCYDLSTTIADLQPGNWQVVYRWLDDPSGSWRDWHLSVTMSGGLATDRARVASADVSACLDSSGAPDDGQVPSRGTALMQNAPNPFNPTTHIAFHLAHETRVRLRVFDLQGRQVRALVDGKRDSGPHAVVWNGTDDAGRWVASGTYLYRLETDRVVLKRMMTLVR